MTTRTYCDACEAEIDPTTKGSVLIAHSFENNHAACFSLVYSGDLCKSCFWLAVSSAVQEYEAAEAEEIHEEAADEAEEEEEEEETDESSDNAFEDAGEEGPE